MRNWWNETGRWRVAHVVYRLRLFLECLIIRPLFALELWIAKERNR